jgi:phosphonopyruvate decarboxylase
MKSKELIDVLKRLGLDFLTGVPDTTLRDFLIYVEEHPNEINHLRAANEGQAVALASGYYLATAKVPIVYMQNSGLGNAVNPLTSLADKEIYGIPMILFIGWRGCPGKPDEPQHIKMGRITLDLLKALEVPFEIVQPNIDKTQKQISYLKEQTVKNHQPVALVFSKGVIEKEKAGQKYLKGMQREEALDILLDKIGNAPIVSTTGYTSREIFEIRERKSQGHNKDFLCVGSMGHASAIALSITRYYKKPVYVIDGDGALCMHMGAVATIGFYAPTNLCHIIIDNGLHESTGGQPTLSRHLNWQQLFTALGYKTVETIERLEDLKMIDFSVLLPPTALVIKVVPGTRSDLGRPTKTPAKNKEEFMRFFQWKHYK